MKFFWSTIMSMTVLFVSVMNGVSQEVTRERYRFDGDFDKIRATAHIEFELNNVNGESAVFIETEQWIHSGRYINVLVDPYNYLRVELSNAINNYPPIKVTVNYRKPLVGLDIEGTGSLRSTNILHTSPSALFNIQYSGTASVTLDLRHEYDMYAAISGTGRFTLNGRVSGTGRFSISGTGSVETINCPMQRVHVQMSGTGFTSVNGINGVDIILSGTGSICYRGPLISQIISGTGSITQCRFEETTTQPTSNPKSTTPNSAATTPDSAATHIMINNTYLYFMITFVIVIFPRSHDYIFF